MTEFTIRTPVQLPSMLKGFRRNAGLTKAQLAMRMGITQQTLSALELNGDAHTTQVIFSRAVHLDEW